MIQAKLCIRSGNHWPPQEVQERCPRSRLEIWRVDLIAANVRGMSVNAWVVALGLAALFPGYGLSQSASPSDAPARVNRILPRVEPPTMGLVFSARPTTQEISGARVFEEPLVPIGGEPGANENAALTTALLGYAKRSRPDDFSSIKSFLEAHPDSTWRAALLTCLGLEYYNTAYYSRALEAWEEALPLAAGATDLKSKAMADRVAGELAGLYSRLGRLGELEALLNSLEGREFVGAASEKITAARESLWSMQHRPEVSFKCGPYALQSILRSGHEGDGRALAEVRTTLAEAASTRNGISLPQVAELSARIGLNYQMAYRASKQGAVRGAFIIPAVVHWKAGHYAALVRREGDRFLVEDPTFGNSVWVTPQALEAEISGYFLVPPGKLPSGWRPVDAAEGGGIWGKGQPPLTDPKPFTPFDPKKPCPQGNGRGMAVPNVHLMLVSLNIVDTPVGYAPPVGPSVQFTMTYNQRDAFQPANFAYANFGPKWTCHWISYITDNPQNASANANLYVPGGGMREFTGFNAAAQAYAFQQYDQTRLVRAGPASYELTYPNGSKLKFSQSDGSIGATRKVFLTQMLDPQGNAVTLSYDGNLRLAAITDAIGQITTLTYGDTNDIYKITRVTDPFGRFADFAYDALGRLTNITDVIGLNSRFAYSGSSDLITALITPYGTNAFLAAQGGGPHGTTRSLETIYPDGSRDRVEYNQSVIPGMATNEPPAKIPGGMAVHNQFLQGRNTYFWSRTASASSYGDYTKAKIYHWLHTENLDVTAGILESTKEALENRVWYNYPGQTGILGPGGIGTSSQPTKVGRVLDDGTTQMYTYASDGFGHVTNSIDPVGRTFSYLYATNGLDLLEVRQTRAGNNELLFRATYNSQHLPLTKAGADGQVTTFTYNSRGQLLTESNPKNETTSYTYDANGYLVAVDGPLPGTNDVAKATYDGLGRVQTRTDVSGYTLTFEHDAMDRLTKIQHPDASYTQISYTNLNIASVRDRAGRQTFFEFDSVQQMKKKTDPLGRVTYFDWCRCGQIKSLTDPLGRTTSWQTDVQGRVVAKQYGDGSQVQYLYEEGGDRLKQVIDEKQQVTHFTWNLDDTLKSETYANAVIPTPAVNYDYDPNHGRRTSMTDGTGTTRYSYYPVTVTPGLGAAQLASVDGPLPNDTITYTYDELGRRVSTAINGVVSSTTVDAAGRVVSETNALGTFSYVYDGSSGRVLTSLFPNGLTVERGYGGNLEDRELQRITHKIGATPVSEFAYGRDHLAHRITTWSQQVGAQPPELHSFGYDAVNQVLSAAVTNSGNLINTFAYGYDALGNRLTEQVGGNTSSATYNALNQISTTTTPTGARTNEWDAKDRLVAVNSVNQRTEFAYDGMSRMVSIRHLTNGVEVSFRRFVWCDNRVCEERDAVGTVTKRFFEQGMKVESGPASGNYFYTRDHLGSVRELTDSIGNVRARYGYDPFGRRSKLSGDLEAEFGFTGLFVAAPTTLSAARFRMYDAELGRWLSRDPLRKAELSEGPNLYAYVGNNTVNAVDPLGLKACCEKEWTRLQDLRSICSEAWNDAAKVCQRATKYAGEVAFQRCTQATAWAAQICTRSSTLSAADDLVDCMMENDCEPADPCPTALPSPGPKPKPPCPGANFSNSMFGYIPVTMREAGLCE